MSPTMNRRKPEPRIDKGNPMGHPKSSVSVRVAADYLDVDVKTLGKWLNAHLLDYLDYPHGRRVDVVELVAFKRRQLVERKAG